MATQTTGALDALKARMADLSALGHASALLTWDQETYMPEGGGEARARSGSTVSRLAHELGTSEEYARLLGDAEAEVAEADAEEDGDDARLLWYARRAYDRNKQVPPELVARIRETTSRGIQVWQAARAADDYASFAPHLEEIVGLQREVAEHLGYEDHPYDALLDMYEPEMKTADVRRAFDDLRERTAPLVRAIAANADRVEDASLAQHFPQAEQLALSRELTERLGYDYARGRMDLTAHPFSTPFARDDVRITVRVDPERFDTCFYAAAHEAGHGLYEQNVPARFEGTPLRGAASMGLHESQSRLWENIVGRGLPFLRSFYPRVQETFPEQLGGVGVDAFYRAVNKSAPSLIRVEADEVTYNLHIMLRFDLELALIEGAVGVDELPARWNAKMQEYLGIAPPSDADGVLQDIHWAGGLFGYFPTYALGNVMSVQLYEAAVRERPEIAERLGEGETTPLLGWMTERVYAHGRKYPPQELLEKATGSRLDAGPYVGYLTRKYGELYGLND